MAIVGNISASNLLGRYNTIKRRAAKAALDLCGGKEHLITVSDPKKIKALDWIGKNLSSAENRLILGASALMTQPFIDASNKDVDKETRKYSICRTIAKILVCTTTGFLIRKGCIKSIDAFTKLPSEIKPDMKFKKLRSCLLPTIEYTKDGLAQHKNTLGTLLALGVMLFTNFLIDAPGTKWLTNVFTGGKNAQSK